MEGTWRRFSWAGSNSIFAAPSPVTRLHAASRSAAPRCSRKRPRSVKTHAADRAIRNLALTIGRFPNPRDHLASAPPLRESGEAPNDLNLFDLRSGGVDRSFVNG